MKVRVLVTPKEGVLDPQGRAIHSALGDLGYDLVSDVRAGKIITLELDTTDPDLARRQATEMCDKLLANPVIESYTLDLGT